jgi:tetratricopeptide (TPR) repeat protein
LTGFDYRLDFREPTVANLLVEEFMRTAMLSLCLIFMCSVPTPAQQDVQSNVPRPVELLPGLGNHHHPISTKNPEAQKFFDQGLALIYGFNFAEAARSFRRAAELDPSAAMPWWGLSLALGRNMNMDLDQAVDAKGAYLAIAKALTLAKAAPENEQTYIEALAKRCSDDPKSDGEREDGDYAAAMHALASRYPDDLDAQTLYADSMMNLHRYDWYEPSGAPAHSHGDDAGTIQRLLESVIQRDPEHFGAHHFYVHLMDTSPTPQYALASAAALRNLAPGLGHIVHMGGHIFLTVGDLEMAARVNEEAAESDRELFKRSPPSDPYAFLYYGHNLHFIMRARAEQGRYPEARRAVDSLMALEESAIKRMPMAADYYLANRLFLLLRFSRWDEILAEPQPPDKSLLITAALQHYARAVAFAGNGDHAKALDEQKAFAAARATIPLGTTFMFNPAERLMEVAARVLEARLASDPKSAIPLWRRAVEAQDAVSYDEPPAWYYPVRQSLGAVLLRAGQAAEAETIFRENLRRFPRNPWSLFGLWKCLEAQGKSVDANWVHREFDTSWRGGDPMKSLRLEDF